MTTARNRKPSLEDPLQYIKGVGPKRARLLEKLGLKSIEDCLYFLPFRYEDRSRVVKIAQIGLGETVTLTGEVVQAGIARIGRRKKIFEVLIKDDTGSLRGKWFRFNETYMTERFQPGTRWIFSGKPAWSRYGGSGLELIHPDSEPVDGEAGGQLGGILPVYHNTEGLHLKSLRALMKNVVERYAPLLEEFIPEPVLKTNALPPRAQAIRDAHLPPKDTSVKDLDGFRTAAQKRLIFEELFLIQVGLAYRKKHAHETVHGMAFKTRGELIRRFVKLLPYELTGAQKRVLGEIMHDLEQPRPMNRLVQGDVGAGKTVIALTALLTAIDNRTQGALMVPTEILAEQHYLTLEPYCRELGVKIDLATSAAPAGEKKKILERIESGETQIVVGTHALIQKTVAFKRLGLAVIDEQHRFGVLQREALGKKGARPHVCIMTATPIPRSLALTLYGEMDVSFLDELPPGRKPITTQIYYGEKRDQAYARLSEEVKQGRQAYVVCPLIEESETLELKAAIDVHDYLKERWFPDGGLALIHGKLKKEERQKIMAAFAAGTLHTLVATTVIEVGIDVPNATLMVIEHAERFGLSQIHQLRGRVGRGEYPSHCFLIAYHPLSDDAKARLAAVHRSSDGFEIAEEDLKIRGPGDFMGTRQSGMPLLRVANLLRDMHWLDAARRQAFALIDRDPLLSDPEHVQLKQTLQTTLGEKLDLLHIL